VVPAASRPATRLVGCGPHHDLTRNSPDYDDYDEGVVGYQAAPTEASKRVCGRLPPPSPGVTLTVSMETSTPLHTPVGRQTDFRLPSSLVGPNDAENYAPVGAVTRSYTRAKESNHRSIRQPNRFDSIPFDWIDDFDRRFRDSTARLLTRVCARARLRLYPSAPSQQQQSLERQKEKKKR
jgi:hypothetical protein